MHVWTRPFIILGLKTEKKANLIDSSIYDWKQIVQELEVDQSIFSRDIKAPKDLSQQFVCDLAKSDLAYYYKQYIDGIEEVKIKHGKNR